MTGVSAAALRRWTRQVTGAAERANRVRAELVIAHADGAQVDSPELARAVGDLDVAAVRLSEALGRVTPGGAR